MDSNSALVEEMISHLEPVPPLVDRDDSSAISRFYAGRSVLVTGATGFIGKALVEKLLRSCPSIKKIYLLVREKRGKDIDERLKDLISSQCFDRIRQLNDGSDQLLREKLCAIKGDITHSKFGVSPDDMGLLAHECSIVFNSAATIRFTEPIDIAVRNNIYSVGQLVEFCNGLDQLEALIHLSTAYSNCHKRDTIYEVFYEPPMRGADIQDTVEKLRAIQDKIHVYPSMETAESGDSAYDSAAFIRSASRDQCAQQNFYFDSLSPDDLIGESSANGQTKQSAATRQQSSSQAAKPFDLLSEFARIALRRSNRPNTYTFTKAISEAYLLDQVKLRRDRYLYNKIPVAIVRPSIVGGAWREPLVGLVDNYNGPTGAILSFYTGALQAMPGCGERVADLVPIDMVANMVLAAGWYLVSEANKCQSNNDDAANADQLPQRDQGAYIFNFVSGYQNPLRWQQVADKVAELAYRYPSKFLSRLPSSCFIRAGKLYELYDRINQRLPALLSDLVRSRLLGQQVESKSSALAGYSRIKQMTETLTPFTSNQWRLCDSNTRALFELLGPSDKSVFNFDVKSIDWNDYLRGYIIGSRIYTLKDEAKNLPAALRSLRRRETINSCFLTLIMFGIFYFVLWHMFLLQAQVDL